VSVVYPDGTTGLDTADLRVHAGELVMLTGPSGAGKSTCLAVLSGRMRPTSGTVLLDGADAGRLGRRGRAAWRRRSALVVQDLRLLERRTVRENVATAAEIGAPGGTAADIERRVAALLDRLGLAETADRRPSAISGGQRQRVTLAQALVRAPDLLCADEPTANLDPATATLVADLIDEHRRAGMACVVATHRTRTFAGVATRHVALVGGRLLASVPDAARGAVGGTGRAAGAPGDVDPYRPDRW
jgi:ABC-type ATPase involved in cell division